jgi:hypothetical protein
MREAVGELLDRLAREGGAQAPAQISACRSAGR